MEVIHPCKYSLECSHAIVKLFLPQRNAKAVVGELIVDEAVNAVVEDGKHELLILIVVFSRKHGHKGIDIGRCSGGEVGSGSTAKQSTI